MAINTTLQLTNGEGLARVVVCSGLSHRVIIHPIVHGEPVLTAQAFYYLDQLESVAKIRFENGEERLSDAKMEYLIDNYLFEYSKLHPESSMTFKVLKGKFLRYDSRSHYLDVDQGLTQALAVDILNDECVESVTAVDKEDMIDLQDWDIGRNYARDCLTPYIEELTKALNKKVNVVIQPSSERDGHLGKMRVIKTEPGLINYNTAMALADICIRDISNTDTTVRVGWMGFGEPMDQLPLERLTAKNFHNPAMLSHYFSGLHEINTLKRFTGFYNVLEYYFEEAPQLLGSQAKTEKSQLECVTKLLVTDIEILQFIADMPPKQSAFIAADLQTSSGVNINGFNSANGTVTDLARWIYEIRCAVIHSKKTRRGITTPTFEPYTATAQDLQNVLPIIRWLAIKCIEKDTFLNPGAHGR